MKFKVKIIIYWTLTAVALFLETTYAIILAEPYNNLDGLWAWLILLAYVGHVCSIVYRKGTFSFVVGIGSAVLFLVGALVCDLEFWLIGLIIATLVTISAMLRK